MNLIIVILALLLAAGAVSTAHFLFMFWRRREEPTVERIDKDLKALESKYRDFTKRLKKLKALDKAQLEAVRQVFSAELKKSAWINTVITFIVSLIFFIAGLFVGRFFK